MFVTSLRISCGDKATHFKGAFAELRRSTSLCNVHFVCKTGAIVPSHQMILALHSPKFLLPLFSEIGPKETVTLFLPEVEPKTLRSLLELLYSGKTVETPEVRNLVDLLRIRDPVGGSGPVTESPPEVIDLDDDDQSSFAEVTVSKKQHACWKCGKTFALQIALNSHIQKQHSKYEQTPVDARKRTSTERREVPYKRLKTNTDAPDPLQDLEETLNNTLNTIEKGTDVAADVVEVFEVSDGEEVDETKSDSGLPEEKNEENQDEESLRKIAELTCFICGEPKRNGVSLRSHVSKHCLTKTSYRKTKLGYECAVCSHPSPKFEHLRVHVYLKHQSWKGVFSGVLHDALHEKCMEYLRTKKRENSPKKHKDVTINIRDLKNTEQAVLDSKNVICFLCKSKNFGKKMAKLRVHLSVAHLRPSLLRDSPPVKESDVFGCQHCGDSFATEASYLEHAGNDHQRIRVILPRPLAAVLFEDKQKVPDLRAVMARVFGNPLTVVTKTGGEKDFEEEMTKVFGSRGTS